MRLRHRLWPVALCAVLVACTGSPVHPGLSQPTVTRTSSPSDAAAACAHPTALATTGRSIGVGSPKAPTIGELSFHPYPYEPGFPTKMIIHTVKEQPRTMVLTGQRCSDGRPLRFWYERNELPPDPPLTEEQLASLGALAQSLPPTTEGADHLGYVLFSGTGPWEITARAGGVVLGVLLVTVVRE